MKTYFETKVRLVRIQDNGLPKEVTESYIVQAETTTEVERIAMEELAPYSNGDVHVQSTRKSNIQEIVVSDKAEDRFFRVKTVFVTVDEKSGRGKKHPAFMLVNAADFKDAYDTATAALRDSMLAWDIALIAETNIVDVLHLYEQ